jgi:hypothetical protein
MTDVECGEYYNNTGKIPPVNLNTWIPVYNILVNAGFDFMSKEKTLSKNVKK